MEKNHKLNSIIASSSYGKTEGFKRPDHNDFALSSELKEREFTGLRANQLTFMWEIWILGTVLKTCSFAEATNDPTLLPSLQKEIFNP